MVCSENDTLINITIPVVMIPKSVGKELTESLATG
jgi:signal peptide peptidase-like 2B